MTDHDESALPGGSRAMSIQRLEAIFDAYGASAARWPANERTAAVDLLDRSDDARRAHVQAMRFDILLDHVSAPPPSPALVRRIHRLGAARRGIRGLIARLIGGAAGGPASGLMVRPAAFALTVALGVVIGFALPHGGSDDVIAARDGGAPVTAPVTATASASIANVAPLVSTVDPAWEGTLVDGPAIPAAASTAQPVTETTESGTLSGIPLI